MLYSDNCGNASIYIHIYLIEWLSTCSVLSVALWQKLMCQAGGTLERDYSDAYGSMIMQPKEALN